ncbi:PAS domain-containing protein [Mesorhizobium sp. M0408]|uniref:PAS domain-containing sensor histidine kinase n=1 Tax=Mesorhizobium sp. M0408 TaxID=2956942 RepID=UPI00333C8949
MTTPSNSPGETDSEAKRALQIIESMPGHAWSADAAGRFTYVSPSTLAFLGNAREDLNTSDDEDEFGWRRVVHPDDYDRVAAKWRHCLETGDHYDTEHRLRRADGVYRWFRNSGRPSRDSQGRITQWYGTTIDIDEQKRAEAALRDRERELSQLVDMVPSHLWRLTPDGEPTFFNKRMIDFLGLDLADTDRPGMSRLDAMIETVHLDDAAKFRDALNRCLVTGESFAMRYRLRRADGVYRWMSSRAEPLRDQDGRIVQWYGLCHDIDDQMHADEALSQLQQMQSDFAHMNRVSTMGELAASLSHEITQPIASARNNARAAQNFLDILPPDLGEVREALACVVGDADRAGDIIDRIREHIKKAPPRKECFDLNAAISEVIALTRSVTTGQTVSVQTRFANGLCLVEGDRVQLQQVILNLILNAVEAIDTVEMGPRDLLISSEEVGTEIEVAVRDSGPGIDPTHLTHVFEAFYTTKPSGTGMGLSICRSIIGAHGGRLWVQANEPRGAVFRFTLHAAEVRS